MTPAEPLTERTAARVIVRDRGGRLLLFRGIDPHSPEQPPYWFTAGGGLDEGETHEQAARRELCEETGLTIGELGEVVHADEVVFRFEGVTYAQAQHYFAVEVSFDGPSCELQRGGWEDYEARSISSLRWWSPEELASTTERFYPEGLVEIAAGVATWGSASLS